MRLDAKVEVDFAVRLRTATAYSCRSVPLSGFLRVYGTIIRPYAQYTAGMQLHLLYYIKRPGATPIVI